MSDVPLPWKRMRIGERRDYEILRVGVDAFGDPRTGVERDRVIIEADDWCNVVPLTRDDRVVMVKQFRFGTREVSLEFPGGIVDRDEDPARTAARELEEETGYRASRILALGGYSPNPAHFTNRVHVFVAFDCEQAHDGTPDEGEDLRVVLVPRSEVRELVTEGKIANAMHVATASLAILKGYV